MPDGTDNMAMRFLANWDRAISLIQLAASMKKESLPPDASPHATSDILRSAVVFLHAMLEDFLRTVGRIGLRASDEKTLNAIGESMATKGKQHKFTLWELSQRKELTVDKLIEETISDYPKPPMAAPWRQCSRSVDSFFARTGRLSKSGRLNHPRNQRIG